MNKSNVENVVAGLEELKSYNTPHKLTEDQKKLFVPYQVESVEDILVMMSDYLRNDNLEALIEMHDRLMVSDIKLAYDVLIVMLKLGDDDEMYMDFVPATTESKIHPKGIYHRCLQSLPIYPYKDSYLNPVLGKESYPEFAKEIIGGMDVHDARKTYRDYVSVEYKDVITHILSIREV